MLKIAHNNICSLRNKVHEVNNFLETHYIHIPTLSETHLAIHGYYIYRKYRNANGGGVAVYIQNHIPVKLREDLMLNTVWLQVHLPLLKPSLVGSCYRPPRQHLDDMCEMLDDVCDINRKIYFLSNLNI